MENQRPRVVIVGGGFGGLQAALHLRHAPIDLTVIDKSNHHLFQPLLYQVATAGLSPANIAYPIRRILHGSRNTQVLLGEVADVDTEANRVVLADAEAIPFDYLLIATGATHSYFGHPEWAANAPGLKSLTDATKLRHNILIAFEFAESAQCEEEKQAWLTFIIVGGGPTGVEMAGAISELANHALLGDFRHIDPRKARIILVEGGPRVLASYDEKLSEEARRELEGLHVEVRVNEMVKNVDDHGVDTNLGRIDGRTVIWAAGVQASPAAKWLKVEPDNSGRVRVTPTLTVEGHPNIYVIGDVARVDDKDGHPLPGVAPVAMQQGRYAAARIKKLVQGQNPTDPFRYFDKGSMATIGRSKAVAQTGKIKLHGLIAWFAWLFIHITYLVGFRNKVLVLLQWAWAYIYWYKGARLITDSEE
jgi:NADH dehydrogenase